MGADAFNPCQPCNDLKALKEAFGDRICFVGGVDSQFVLSNPTATPDDVREEVRQRIFDLAPGGGYLVGPSHSVPYEKEKLAAMMDAIETYGREVYRK
jgi:uroporphyrinogen decarboxylase